ncbi:DUF1707 and DUF4190 domain-containing protein [Wenjunlia tyrosinilytica]
MRASHADRERAVDVLKAAYAEGRLNKPEYEQRMGRAYSAATYGELNMLVADLPQGPVPGQFVGPVAPVPATFLPPPPRPTNSYALASLICGIAVPFTGVSAIPAVILGHLAKSQLRTSNEEGDGLATAGLVLGWLGIAFGVAIVLLMVGMVAAVSTP